MARTGSVRLRFVDGGERTLPIHGVRQLQFFTVPIHVYLDGTEIQTLLERRLVENLNQQGKSVRA